MVKAEGEELQLRLIYEEGWEGRDRCRRVEARRLWSRRGRPERVGQFERRRGGRRRKLRTNLFFKLVFPGRRA